MRILVVSDSHGDYYNFKRIVMSQPSAEVIIFLGDGEDQADEIKLNFPMRMVISVKGNCDWCSVKNTEEIITLFGKKLFITHGHMYDVKFGYSTIYEKAHKENCNILLFGHTHTPFTDYDNGLYIMNPGSIKGANCSYGYIDITSQGIVTNIVKL